MVFKYPLARWNLWPGVRNTGSADLTEEQDAHAHLLAAGKTDRLQGQPDFDVIPIIDDLRRAVPHEIRLELLTGRGRIQRVHLNAAGIHEQVICGLAGS